MNRNIIYDLIQWKNRDNRKPLILDGARQVGKTWVLKEFGRTEFQNTVYINCDQNEKIREIFSGSFDISSIISKLEIYSRQKIEKKFTLIIFDEIQEIPPVLTSLKYFCEDGREYYVAAAGSLLGLSLHAGTGFPVGKVDLLHLYPMSFSEFVLAVRGENLCRYLLNEPLENLSSFHTEFKELLRQYYFTGGMPEAVLAFSENRSVGEIRTIQNSILYSYDKDISKHADPKDIQRIHLVWNSIPQQLAKENRRFIYGAIKHGARSKDFETAIQWLIEAGLVHKISRIKKACLPLKFYEDFDSFKLFILDCGLLGAIVETPPENILIGDNIFEEYKGAFTEQFVLEQFLNIKDTSCWYFSADDSKQELDFLLQNGSRIIPVEVKTKENLRAKSLRQFSADNGIHGIRFSMSQYREQDWMTNVPLYAVERVLELNK